MPPEIYADLPPGYCLREAANERDFESFAELAKSYHDWLDADLNSFQNFEEELEALPGSYAAPAGCILLVSFDSEFADSNNRNETSCNSAKANNESTKDAVDIACVAIRPVIKHEGEEPARSIDGPAEAAEVIREAEKGEKPPDCAGPVCPLYNREACAVKRLWVEQEHQKSGLGKVLLSAALTAANDRGYKKVVLDTLEKLTSANKLYEQIGFERRTPFYHNPLPGAVYWEKEL